MLCVKIRLWPISVETYFLIGHPLDHILSGLFRNFSQLPVIISSSDVLGDGGLRWGMEDCTSPFPGGHVCQTFEFHIDTAACVIITCYEWIHATMNLLYM